MRTLYRLGGLAVALAFAPAAGAQILTSAPAQLVPADPHWETTPIFTVGETIDGYQPPGIPDGLGAWQLNDEIVRVLVNHELGASSGYAYTLANGTTLTGARVSYFDLDRASYGVVAAGPAYHTVIDRYGDEVVAAEQINEGVSSTDGFDRFCSSSLFLAGQYGLADAVYFTGEETGDGQEFALDVQEGVLYAAPWLGRAAWENLTLVDVGNPRYVGIVVGDDREGAPLYLYVGKKNAVGDGSFLDRNGLAFGRLFVWVSASGDASPQDFNGTGSSRAGYFLPIRHYDPRQAGQDGYDEAGFADTATLDAMSAVVGAFAFSRPEDVATNPQDGTQVLFASTGRGSAYPADDWGTTYLVDINFDGGSRMDGRPSIPATLTILYDGDDAGAGQFSDPDYGLRSPDNVAWAYDGYGYLQEDRSTSNATFGGVSGEEASVWKLDPATGVLTRIAQIDRSAVPSGQTDPSPSDIGNWESSGVIDVTHLFEVEEGATLLLADVQAHSLSDGPIAANNLVQGGQLLMLKGSAATEGAAMMAANSSAQETIARFALDAAYPNPFRSASTLRIQAPEAGFIRVAVFDALGRQVALLLNATVEAGMHTVRFDSAALPSGPYFVRLESAEGVQTQRVMVVK